MMRSEQVSQAEHKTRSYTPFGETGDLLMGDPADMTPDSAERNDVYFGCVLGSYHMVFKDSNEGFF